MNRVARLPKKPTMHEVVIVGGGLVGGLTALLLAQADVPVIVLDAAPAVTPERLVQRDARVYALSPASIGLLTQAGVWQYVIRHAPYQGMQVWNKDGRGQLEFGQLASSAVDEPQWLGSMVETSVLAWAMQQALQASKVQLRQRCRVQRLDWFGASWQVTVDGEQLHTKLLIGADGAQSLVRESANIQTRILDYKQSAITCAIRTERPHDGIARQVFLAGGPLAFLPMADLLADDPQGEWQSVVWSLPTDEAEALYQESDEVLARALTHASQSVLGKVLAVEARGLFPLRARQAVHDTKPQLVLIGDAAHVVHPMAGQGVNLGIMDAGVLVDGLLHDRARGLWAHEQTLRKYAAQRRLPTSLMMHGLSALGWLEGDRHQVLKWLRGEGTHLVAQATPLMALFTQQASGWSQLAQTRYAQHQFNR